MKKREINLCVVEGKGEKMNGVNLGKKTWGSRYL